MRHLTLILYILLIAVLGIATFVESAKGSSFVMEYIYHSIPFMVLWGVLSVLMIFSLWNKTFFQVGPKILLHFSQKPQLLAQEKQICAAPRAKVGKSALPFCKHKREKASDKSGAFRVAVFCLFTPR
jgi:hypothetical protein